MKIEGPRSHLRSGGRCYIADPHRPTSDGLMYTSAYPVNNRRVEFEVSLYILSSSSTVNDCD